MDNSGISLNDVWRSLRRRKFRVLLAAILGAAAAVAISEGMPTHYTSEALLAVEAHSPITRELEPTVQATTPDQVKTEVDILQSRALAESVVRELNLENAPDLKSEVRPPTWIDYIVLGVDKARAYAQSFFESSPPDAYADAVTLFQRRLTVLANDKSHVVVVRFRSGSPKLSADVVNALLTKYLSNQVGVNLDVTSQENQWLTQHLSDLQHEVDVAAARAQAFRDANGLVDIQAGSLSAIQLNEREQTLSNALQELAKAQAAYDTAANAARTGSGFIGDEALGSTLIQRLREREADVLQRLAALRQRGGDNSPYLQPVVAELKSVRQQIESETGKIVGALGRNVATAQMRVKSLETAVSNSQAQARQNIGAAAKLAQLNQEVEAKRHVYIAFLTRMEQTQLTSTKFPSARVVSQAVPPFQADGTSLSIVAIIGAVVGTFIMVAASLLRHVLGGRILSAKDVEFLTGVPPIGILPALPSGGGLPIPMRILDMSQSSMVETLHAMRFSIQAMNPHAHCTRVLVTSATQAEGKTTLAASLARLSAATGLRVLLVEADLRRPTLGRLLRFSPRISIETLLTSGHRLADAVNIDPRSGLHCLTASGSAPNVITALQSSRFDDLMEEARAAYDMVIMDSPPVMLVVDPLILSKRNDVILFAVAFGQTPTVTVAEALHRFPHDVRPRVATVLTRVPQSEATWHGSYAGYQHKLASSA